MRAFEAMARDKPDALLMIAEALTIGDRRRLRLTSENGVTFPVDKSLLGRQTQLRHWSRPEVATAAASGLFSHYLFMIE